MAAKEALLPEVSLWCTFCCQSYCAGNPNKRALQSAASVMWIQDGQYGLL